MIATNTFIECADYYEKRSFLQILESHFDKGYEKVLSEFINNMDKNGKFDAVREYVSNERWNRFYNELNQFLTTKDIRSELWFKNIDGEQFFKSFDELDRFLESSFYKLFLVLSSKDLSKNVSMFRMSNKYPN